NDPCSALSGGDLRGTCLSAQECSTQGGSADGKCAAGFGVCCLFRITGCGGSVTKNAGFPASDPNNDRICTVTLNRFANGMTTTYL
ncbi:hypothetical protein TCAL_12449, partial [Tigriopus californicus]